MADLRPLRGECLPSPQFCANLLSLKGNSHGQHEASGSIGVKRGDAWGGSRGLCCWPVTLAGCAAAIARNPVPASLEGDVEVVGMGPTQIRFWGDELPPNADAMVREKWAQVRANRPELLAKRSPTGGQFPRAVGRRL